jgi:uncharacterized protein YpmB
MTGLERKKNRIIIIIILIIIILRLNSLFVETDFETSEADT